MASISSAAIGSFATARRRSGDCVRRAALAHRSVDDRSKVLEVERHRSGKIRQFDNVMSEPVHDRLSAEMRAVLEGGDIPAYLDAAAVDFQRQGRELGLPQIRFLPAGKDTHVPTWRGTEANAVLAITMVSAGLECAVHEVGVTVLETTPEEAEAVLRQLAERPPDIQPISEFVENIETARFDGMVPEQVPRRLWAKARMNIGPEIRTNSA
ncbi:hypothetical protein [Mesorhizobium silamurunense]|uniref:hypothetical protein n=1 Tax=Mesorhizobium silamurunense TaxID=499528 RepID=UPI00177B2489|nr:hypothetical protein [Mesorhizobium silamurunense]